MDVDASYDLDTTVHNWSDFNRIFYHPRSMNQITTHHMDDTIMPFDAYPVGKQSYKDFERVILAYRRSLIGCRNIIFLSMLGNRDL